MTTPLTTAEHDAEQPKRPVKVWDLPVRLFHWALVAALAISWWSGEEGNFTVHFISGHVVVGLIVFRVLWGVLGSQTARFRDFVRGPGAVLRYARRMFGSEPEYSVGHNPAGAVMVLLLMVVVAVQAGTGLFASEMTYAFVEGPLAPLVDSGTSEALTSLHKSLLFNALLALVTLHIVAALAYLLIKRENLINAMVTGWKTLPAEKAERAPRMASPLVAAGVAAVAVAVAGGLYAMT